MSHIVARVSTATRHATTRSQGQESFGKDKHSLFGVDPLFVDAAKMDFRLQANSPALKQIGFEPWNYSDVGPVGVVGPPVARSTRDHARSAL